MRIIVELPLWSCNLITSIKRLSSLFYRDIISLLSLIQDYHIIITFLIIITYHYMGMDQYLLYNTIFNGMNIHLPAILMWTTGVFQGFDTLPYHHNSKHHHYHYHPASKSRGRMAASWPRPGPRPRRSWSNPSRKLWNTAAIGGKRSGKWP